MGEGLPFVGLVAVAIASVVVLLRRRGRPRRPTGRDMDRLIKALNDHRLGAGAVLGESDLSMRDRRVVRALTRRLESLPHRGAGS